MACGTAVAAGTRCPTNQKPSQACSSLSSDPMAPGRFALLVVLLAAAVAAGSFAVAYRVLDDEDAAPAPPAVASDAPTPTATEPATTTVPPIETGSTTIVPLTEPGELDTPTWVVVVSSGTSRRDADDTARRLASSGYPAGVLHSDDHSSMTKGLWVAYAGPYPDSATAQSSVDRLTGDGFEGSYPRCVGDKKDCERIVRGPIEDSD